MTPPYILEYAAKNAIHRHSRLQIIRNNSLAKHKALDQMAHPTAKSKDLNQTTDTLKVVACAGRDAGEKRGTKGSALIFCCPFDFAYSALLFDATGLFAYRLY